MSSRGQNVRGTDGSDHAFRQTVAQQYKEIPKVQEQLRFAAVTLFLPYCAFLVALAALMWVQYGRVPFDLWAYPVVLALPAPVHLSLMGKKRRKAYTVLFSTLCGLSAAYVLAIGVGRTLTGLDQHGVDSLGVAVLAGHVYGIAVLLLAVYRCRRLITLYDYYLTASTAKRS